MIIYEQVQDRPYKKTEQNFSEIKELKEFMRGKINYSQFNGLYLEKEGKKVALVLPVYLGDEGYKANFVESLSDEKAIKYRPYLDSYEIQPEGYKNPEIVEDFILFNVMRQVDKKDRVLKQMQTIRSEALNSNISDNKLKNK